MTDIETKEQAGDGLLPCLCGQSAGIMKAHGEYFPCCSDPMCPFGQTYATEQEAKDAWNRLHTRPASPADGEAYDHKALYQEIFDWCSDCGPSPLQSEMEDLVDTVRRGTVSQPVPYEDWHLGGYLRTMISYAKWQIKEGKDYHPTLPSAIEAAEEALQTAALTQPAPEPKEDAEAALVLDWLDDMEKFNKFYLNYDAIKIIRQHLRGEK